MGRSKRRLTACFTGHRPDKFGGYDEDHPASVNAKRAIAATIEQLIDEYEEVEFISGAALGVDMWAAEYLVRRKLQSDKKNFTLTLAIPCIGQQNAWPPYAQLRWLSIFRNADVVHFCDQGKYAPYKMMNRNKWMVDNAELVISVWNGEEKGGTAHCVDYAIKRQKNI